MGAFSVDHGFQFFAPQSPLHEGRRYRVDPSSAKETLAVVERDSMRRLICRYRVSPINIVAVGPIEKRQPLFQIIEDLSNLWRPEPHARSDQVWTQRLL
jgi:hypothetical protein